jgi:S-adenosyl-L-methionine hydrolase (adenosine-forming)
VSKRSTSSASPSPKIEAAIQPAGRSEVTGGIVTLLSDFGQRDGFVGIVKGIVLGICPGATIVDLSHDVPPQDVTGGALILASAVGYFPDHTVHLAVVDPGVGTARRPILVETERFVLIGPDNGLLSVAADAAPVRRVIHLDRPEFFSPSPSHTFHARDVFAPVAGHCARGVECASLGSPLDGFARLSLPAVRRLEDALEGQVIHIDRFGNLMCNIRREDLSGFREPELSISIGGVQIAGISPHYSAVREGKPVALWNSWGRLEVAVRNGSAVRHLRTRNGDRVQVKFRR